MGRRSPGVASAALVTLLAVPPCLAPPAAASLVRAAHLARPARHAVGPGDPADPGSVHRRAEPAATLTGPVTTGHIVEPATAAPVDLSAHGYVEHEYFASGTAVSFAPRGRLGRDGRWSVRPSGSAPYRTRIVVRRPRDPRRFNGTVLVEWFNVSAGGEADPDWRYLSGEILRGGYAYVGVSAQALGVEGGTPLLAAPGRPPDGGLRGEEPARYGSLTHPGDQYAYDIFSQVGRALRVEGPGGALGTLRPRRIVAVGESQSAFFLTTYVDAVQPVAQVFDGFFIHSRGGTAAPLDGGSIASASSPRGVRVRSDLAVPVFVFETETDLGPLLDYGPARQADTDRFRAWEVAGTAHADAFLVGPAAGLLGCPGIVNEGPEHEVADAALHALNRWVAGGRPPPRARRIRLAGTGDRRHVVRDALGEARGGVRTPAVDVPVAVLSGQAPAGAAGLCALFGSTRPFDDATLTRLYGTRARYLAAFRHSLDRAVDRGFLLRADRAALLAGARAVRFAPAASAGSAPAASAGSAPAASAGSTAGAGRQV